MDKIESLKPFLPPEFWSNRDFFFYEGMQLEIGPFFRSYAPPPEYQAATAQFKGQPRVGPESSLENYTAGQPFPMDEIDCLGDPRETRSSGISTISGMGMEPPLTTTTPIGTAARSFPSTTRVPRSSSSYPTGSRRTTSTTTAGTSSGARSASRPSGSRWMHPSTPAASC
jgi:hypothetical protein